MIKPYLRCTALVLWSVGTTILLLPYVAPLGLRIDYVATTAPSYLHRWLESDFWRACWGMSSQLIDDSRYNGHDPVSLARLVVIFGLYAGAFWLRIGNLTFAVFTSINYLLVVIQSWIILDFSAMSCLSMVLGAVSLSCTLRPREIGTGAAA